LVAAKTTGGNLSFGLYGIEPPSTKQIQVIAGTRRYNRSGGFTVTTLKRVVEADGTVQNESLGSDSYRPLGGSAPARRRGPVRRRRSASLTRPRPVAAPPVAASSPA
ncbi:MAG: hypothetical protein H7Z41_04570, partial [Cytophagales bacterium]|nr:hypothetical protein [Armatimonadota bacterium]